MKSRYQATRISPFFSIFVNSTAADFNLSQMQKHQVEAIWESEKGKSANIYNGKLLSFIAFDQERLLAKFVDYNYYIAQLVDPALKSIFGIKPICVSCMTYTGKEWLIGRRSENVTSGRRLLELAPAGGIDPRSVVDGQVDLNVQVFHELEEETGLLKENVKEIVPIVLLYDFDEEVYEVCMKIEVHKKIADFNLSANSEYEELSWVSEDQLTQLLQNQENQFLPLSRYLIHTYLTVPTN